MRRICLGSASQAQVPNYSFKGNKNRTDSRDVVRDLSAIGLESVYHFRNQELQGKEKQPTFFMYRRPDKPYHIDHAFASADIIQSSVLSIGKAEDWLEFSDHMPIIVDLAAG